MALFKIRDRQARKAFKAHHASAMKAAQDHYDLHSHEGVITRTFQDGEDQVITSATPVREAWETYFNAMSNFGEDPWKGYALFDKDLKR